MADEKRKPKKWIAKATVNAHGQFRRKAEAAGETTRQFASEHEPDSGKTGEQARLAENLMGMSHGDAKKKARRKTLYDHPRSKRLREQAAG